MRDVFKALGLLLLLLMAQQGAVNHELSHFSATDQAGQTDQAERRVDSGGVAEATCALCAAFAQVITPTFSHSFHIPPLVRVTSQLSPEPRFVAVNADVPRPRSRGPPRLG
jgi:hypothetical protein